MTISLGCVLVVFCVQCQNLVVKCWVLISTSCHENVRNGQPGSVLFLNIKSSFARLEFSYLSGQFQYLSAKTLETTSNIFTYTTKYLYYLSELHTINVLPYVTNHMYHLVYNYKICCNSLEIHNLKKTILDMWY